MQSHRKTYYVYNLANRSKTLYTGVTNNLERRMWEHKQRIGSVFASKYKIDRLVYHESYDDSPRCHPSSEANQRLAAHQENCVDRLEKSGLA